MSHPCRLSLRAPPHLPFIQGWPGIPPSADRLGAAIHGVVEVRIGLNPIKAKWVRVEIRKHEVLPAGFPPQQGETWEHVGEIVALWSPPAGKEWADLDSADYKFSLPLPENIPPSVDVLKGGIRYELVAALCYKNKDGMFKKGSTGIAKVSEQIRITKHELHSAWPVYSKPDSRTFQDAKSSTSLTVQRPSTAFGPADKILLTATLRSNRTQAFKLKGFDCHLHEILTALPGPSKDKKRKSTQPIVKSRIVASTRIAIGEMVAMGGEKSARIEMAVPKDKLLITVRNARALEIAYEVEVKAVCDTLPPLSGMGIRYTVGALSRPSAQQAVNEIGFVETLCPQPNPMPNGTADPRPQSYPGPPRPSPNIIPGPPPVSRPTSSIIPGPPPGNIIPGPPPNVSPGLPPGMPGQNLPPVQSAPRGFELRDRATQVQPNMAFPMPNAPQRAPSTVTSDTSGRAQSPDRDQDFNPNRYSSATFGPIQRDSLIPSRVPPTTWQQSASLGGSSRPTSMQTPRTQAQYASAIEEKNAQKKKYEAADAAASRRVVSEPLKLPDEPPIPYDQIDLSEKEQIQRYHDAKQKVETAQAKPGTTSPGGVLEAAAAVAAASPVVVNSGPTPSPQLSPSSPPQPAPAPYLSAAEEKDMMRKRYEDAQKKVARAQGPSGGSSPLASPALAGSSTMPTAIASGSPVAGGSGYMSAGAEKDLMRKRYEEATSKVARTQGTPEVSPTPSAANTVPNPASPSVPGPAPYLSAAEEKDMMRRRYEEATSKVARTQGTANSPTPSAATTVPKPASPPPASGSGAYMSAAEEKDVMRRRYEDASQKVARAQGGASSSSPPAASSSTAAPLATAYMSATEEKDLMRQRYEEASKRVAGGSSSPSPEKAPPSFAAASGSGSGAFMSAAEEKDLMRERYDKATAKRTPTTSPPPSSPIVAIPVQYFDGPPPPLPTRPPADYINLLSPTTEKSNAFEKGP